MHKTEIIFASRQTIFAVVRAFNKSNSKEEASERQRI